MDKKKLLLEAALKLFVEHGFHATPTSKIAKEAGIANGTLFYFFPTKEELVVALYLDIKARMMEYMAGKVKTETTLHGILRAYYSASLNWALKNQLEFRFIEQSNPSPYLSKIAKEELQQQQKPFLDLIEQGIRDKVIRPREIDILMTLFSGHIFAISKYLASKKLTIAKKDAVMNDTFDMLWDMIT